MLEIVNQIGWPLWPLILASVVGLALLLERLALLRAGRVTPKGLLKQVMPLAAGPVSEETLATLREDSPLGQLFAEVLAARSRAAALERLETAAALVGDTLSKNIALLGSIGSIAPLLGLFGTVVGMIEIFAAHRTGADPAELAHGISVALYCTAFGILVAVPAILCHRALRRRADTLLIRAANQASLLLEARFPADSEGQAR